MSAPVSRMTLDLDSLDVASFPTGGGPGAALPGGAAYEWVWWPFGTGGGGAGGGSGSEW